MIDLGKEIYECLDKNGWSLCGWGRDYEGLYWEIESESNLGRRVMLGVNCKEDTKKEFIDNIYELYGEFDSLALATSWIDDGASEPIEELIEDAEGIRDSLQNLHLDLSEIDLEKED